MESEIKPNNGEFQQNCAKKKQSSNPEFELGNLFLIHFQFSRVLFTSGRPSGGGTGITISRMGAPVLKTGFWLAQKAAGNWNPRGPFSSATPHAAVTQPALPHRAMQS